MSIILPAYDVLLDAAGETVEHRLTVLHADQLHAEQATPRLGVHDLRQQPLEWSTIVAWSAARRQGVFGGEYPEFRAACLHLEPVDEDELQPVDPTTPAPSAG